MALPGPRQLHDSALPRPQPHELPFGGRGFSFKDPEGNLWDVIFVEGTSFDEGGSLVFP